MISCLIDTNVVFSALYKPQSPSGIVIYLGIIDKIRMYSTEHIRDEIKVVLVEKLDYSNEEVRRLLLAISVEWIPQTVYKDEMKKFEKILSSDADRSLLACAKILGIPIISRDKDFQSEQVKRIAKVFTPPQFITFLLKNNIITRNEINKIIEDIKKYELLFGI